MKLILNKVESICGSMGSCGRGSWGNLVLYYLFMRKAVGQWLSLDICRNDLMVRQQNTRLKAFRNRLIRALSAFDNCPTKDGRV